MNFPLRSAFVGLLSLLAIVPFARAQEKSAAEWSVALSKPAAAAGDVVEVIITARLPHGWIAYSSDFKADLGPQPTQLTLDPSDAFQLVGEIISVKSKRKKDRTWDTEFGYFEDRAEFRQKIKILKPRSAGVTVRIKGQLCNESDGTCTLIDETVKA